MMLSLWDYCGMNSSTSPRIRIRELGSDFHLPKLESGCDGVGGAWKGRDVMFASGRDALRALIAHGMPTRDWRRLWIPSYYCQKVVSSLVSTGITLQTYPDRPLDLPNGFEQIDTKPGDVVLRVNLLGLRHLSDPGGWKRNGVEVIDDHTHDPWSSSANSAAADWCIVSLRKTLPLPDGGVIWSPVDHELPTAVSPTSESHTATMERLAAMVLKYFYLAGADVAKSVFRALYEDGERQIGTGSISGISSVTKELLKCLPAAEWRLRRRENFEALSLAIEGTPWLRVLKAEDMELTSPFAAALVFDTAERRDHVRQRLTAQDIYTTVLWPLEEPAVAGICPRDVEISRRIICIHCDMRYNEFDMMRVAEAVVAAGQYA